MDSAESDWAGDRSPIVLLTFPYSRAEILSDMLSSLPGLVCTSRTGVVPLCHAVVRTWESIDRRGKPLPLAISSMRWLAGLMVGALTAQSGGSRWCEIAVSGTAVAESFLLAFPAARFICFHRRCDSVIADVLKENPWGLEETEPWRRSSFAPGNNVAAVADYWLQRSLDLVEFEAAHPHSTLRVKLEDLTHPDRLAADAICDFISVPYGDGTIRRNADETGRSGGDLPDVPTAMIPASMRQRINELHARLGYPEL